MSRSPACSRRRMLAFAARAVMTWPGQVALARAADDPALITSSVPDRPQQSPSAEPLAGEGAGGRGS